MDSFRSIIDKWPSLPAFAADLDVIYVTAQAMKRRDSVSAEHWPALVAAAERRGIKGVTLEALASIKAARRQSEHRAA